MNRPSLLTRDEAIQSILEVQPVSDISQYSNADLAELYAALHSYTDEELLIVGIDPTV